eukprot:scaffold41668_cov63-Phaeocystis_antarctica.AAC.4
MVPIMYGPVRRSTAADTGSCHAGQTKEPSTSVTPPAHAVSAALGGAAIRPLRSRSALIMCQLSTD